MKKETEVVEIELSKNDAERLAEMAKNKDVSVSQFLMDVIEKSYIPVSNDSPKELFGKNIRFLRKAKMLSAEETAAIIDEELHPNTIYNWEKGNRLPTVKNIRSIEKAFNIKVEDLLSKDFQLRYMKQTEGMKEESLVAELLSGDYFTPEQIKNIQHNIPLMRMKKGWTQFQLAEQKELLVSQASVANWERGRRAPSLRTVHKLTKIFDVSFGDFVNHQFSEEEIQKLIQSTKKRKTVKRKKRITPLAKNLLFLRNELSLSRMQVTERTKGAIHYQMLYKWEKGLVYPSERKLEELCQFYDVDPEALKKRNFVSEYKKGLAPKKVVKQTVAEIENPNKKESNMDQKIFAENLRYLKNAFGLKTSEFIEMMPFTVSTKEFFNWEKAESLPKLEEIEAISNFFSIPVKKLCTVKLKEEELED